MIKRKTVFIFHGRGGKRSSSWLSWLAKELKKSGYKVIYPSFPKPTEANYQSWQSEFQKYENNIDKNSIFIGHSLGCVFILRFLNKFPSKINKIIFVAPPLPYNFSKEKIIFLLERLNSREIKNIESFLCEKYDWEKFKKNFQKIKLYFSDNDYHIPLDNSKYYENVFGKNNVILKKNKGHFNEKNNVFTFPEVLKEIISQD